MTRIQFVGVIGLVLLSLGVLVFALALSNLRGTDASSTASMGFAIALIGIVFLMVAATQWLWGPWS